VTPTTARFLIDEIGRLDLIATQLAGPIGELNRDQVLGYQSLETLAMIQFHAGQLRRQVHAAGALDALKKVT
jgi:hypothetical protein